MGNRVAGEDKVQDCFPVGMRVLAVDDDKTCLKVLENLLRKCQYQVTTTTQSIKALEMLRENRNKFDLVISDVNMPDMDGFKLLELVGLEMDLPVIRYGDRERVMKGVIHGACDYLMKPVRIEELQNIWQHVVRKKIDCMDQKKYAIEEKGCNMVREDSQVIATENIADQNRKLCLKRKKHCEVEVENEGGQGNGQENEESSNHKKIRLVWDAELHSKFLAAVNQLGIDKAFPKRILDMMNVEGLTRENVASHLQKYRQSLKKPTQQASMVVALGSNDPYLQMSSIEGYGDLCTSSRSGLMSSAKLSSYPSGGMFCRLNSPSGFNMRGMSSSALVQPVQPRNINSSIKTFGHTQLPVLPSNQFPTPTGIPSGVNNSLAFFSNNHLLVQGNSSPMHNSGAFRNNFSHGTASVNAPYASSNLLDYNRHNESWQSGSQISNIPATTSPVNKAFNNNQQPQNNLNFSSSTFHSGNIPVDFSSTGAVDVPLKHCQEGLLGNILLASCYTKDQNNKGVYNKDMNCAFSSGNSLISPKEDTNSLGHSLNQNNAVCSKRTIDASLIGQVNVVNPSITQAQSSEVEKFYSMKSNDASTSQPMKSEDGLIQNNSFQSFDHMMDELVRQNQNAMMFIGGELDFDDYSAGSCL
ncbi:hypothetical protein RJT34_32739 [Clitoria ternatea]|uniref:Two-component response regulator n=1 Tax=Clitoria ternatea TaxID=43366 RepID=A0AAN9EZ13_CLITE